MKCQSCQAKGSLGAKFCRKWGNQSLPDQALEPETLAQHNSFAAGVARGAATPQLLSEYGASLFSVGLHAEALLPQYPAADLAPENQALLSRLGMAQHCQNILWHGAKAGNANGWLAIPRQFVAKPLAKGQNAIINHFNITLARSAEAGSIAPDLTVFLLIIGLGVSVWYYGQGALDMTSHPSAAITLIQEEQVVAATGGLQSDLLRYDLPPQEEVRQEEYATMGRKTESIHTDLMPVYGTLKVAANPGEAEVLADDTKRGVTPMELEEILAERTRVKVQKQNVALNDSVGPKVGNVKPPAGGIEFVRVAGGTFAMGCGSWQSDCQTDELPAHSVTVDDFEMGKYEITQGQWMMVMGNSPSLASSCGDNCPVSDVSWGDVQRFVRKLNDRRDGFTYRLPTEAEWEYACRSGGKEEKYCGGNDVDQMAWFNHNSDNKTHPVGQKLPNGLGLYDMSGNVLEWTCSDYGSYSDPEESYAKCSGEGSRRVIRGGNWLYDSAHVRSADRYNYAPGIRGDILGFRLARTHP